MTTPTNYRLSAEGTALGRSEPIPAQRRVSIFRAGSETVVGADIVSPSPRFRPAQKISRRDTPRASSVSRTKRRLKGFLVELHDVDSPTREARVAFIENGETILYDLPASQILKAGITEQNQPFQMDEVEIEDENGDTIFGYRFIALAKPSDAYIETLHFDDERKRKRDLIFQEFGQPES